MRVTDFQVSVLTVQLLWWGERAPCTLSTRCTRTGAQETLTLTLIHRSPDGIRGDLSRLLLVTLRRPCSSSSPKTWRAHFESYSSEVRRRVQDPAVCSLTPQPELRPTCCPGAWPVFLGEWEQHLGREAIDPCPSEDILWQDKNVHFQWETTSWIIINPTLMGVAGKDPNSHFFVLDKNYNFTTVKSPQVIQNSHITAEIQWERIWFREQPTWYLEFSRFSDLQHLL